MPAPYWSGRALLKRMNGDFGIVRASNKENSSSSAWDISSSDYDDVYISRNPSLSFLFDIRYGSPFTFPPNATGRTQTLMHRPIDFVVYDEYLPLRDGLSFTETA